MGLSISHHHKWGIRLGLWLISIADLVLQCSWMLQLLLMLLAWSVCRANNKLPVYTSMHMPWVSVWITAENLAYVSFLTFSTENTSAGGKPSPLSVTWCSVCLWFTKPSCLNRNTSGKRGDPDIFTLVQWLVVFYMGCHISLTPFSLNYRLSTAETPHLLYPWVPQWITAT